MTETTGEESADHPANTGDGPSDRKGYFDILCPESTEARPPSSSNSKYEVNRSTQASSTPANRLVNTNLPKSQQQQDSDAAPSQDNKVGADPIRGALQRSFKAAGRNIKAGTGSYALKQLSEKTQTEHQIEESLRASQNNMTEDESTPDKESFLLGYDAQWCWVESQDDVTFL